MSLGSPAWGLGLATRVSRERPGGRPWAGLRAGHSSWEGVLKSWGLRHCLWLGALQAQAGSVTWAALLVTLALKIVSLRWSVVNVCLEPELPGRFAVCLKCRALSVTVSSCLFPHLQQNSAADLSMLVLESLEKADVGVADELLGEALSHARDSFRAGLSLSDLPTPTPLHGTHPAVVSHTCLLPAPFVSVHLGKPFL